MKLLEQLLDQLRRQPAAYAVTGLGAVAALVIAFGHLSVTDAGILSGAATAAGTIITAVLARPVNFTVISGAAATILQALVLFNVHMSSGEIAAVVGGINFILGIIAVPAVATPVIALRQTRAVDHVGLPSTASRRSTETSRSRKAKRLGPECPFAGHRDRGAFHHFRVAACRPRRPGADRHASHAVPSVTADKPQ